MPNSLGEMIAQVHFQGRMNLVWGLGVTAFQTEYANLKKKADGTYPTYEEVKAVYDKYYKEETFVRVLQKGECPETKWVEGSNFVDVNFTIDERTGRIIMMGALDNLVKGAAGQAVQNMNILFGLPENEGLMMVPMFP